MNKNIEEIKKYFTEEIRTQVREMTNDEMKASLRDLEGTPAWFAILKYNQERVGTIQNAFLTFDPVKQPTEIARYQGVITGMLDLQDAVLSLKYESKKAEDPKNKEEENLDEKGGAYGVY